MRKALFRAIRPATLCISAGIGIPSDTPRLPSVWLLFFFLTLVPDWAGAEVYRCPTASGRIAYQSRPCTGGTETGIDDRPEPVKPRADRHPSWNRSPPARRGERLRRTSAAKAEFQRAHPCPSTRLQTGPCPGYIVDHVTPLSCGGADAPANMQWQTRQDAKEKDRWERDLCRPLYRAR